MEWEVCAFCGLPVYEDEGWVPEYGGYLCEECSKMLHKAFQQKSFYKRKDDKNEV